MRDSIVCAMIKINLDLYVSFPMNGKLCATYSIKKEGSWLCRVERSERLFKISKYCFFFLEGLDEVELNLLLFYFFLVAYSIENRISVFL